MKLTKIVFCLTMLCAATTSCVREDMDDCWSTNKLLLSYKGDGTTEIFPDKIGRVEMFVFDAENKCVSSSLLPQEQVESRTALLPNLQPGDYRIVCLGNTFHTQTEGIDGADYARMNFAAADYFDGNTVTGNDSLYYASIIYPVLPFTGQEDMVKTAEFAASHYDFLVEVDGVPVADNGALPRLRLSGVLPLTDFENRAGGQPTDYWLETEHNAESMMLTARANIMRHTDHAAVNLSVVPAAGGDPLAVVNLADFLAAHPAIDCSKQEVLIPIRIEFKSGQVTVTVPQWYVEHVKPEF